jgi:hypothetical protein
MASALALAAFGHFGAFLRGDHLRLYGGQHLGELAGNGQPLGQLVQALRSLVQAVGEGERVGVQPGRVLVQLQQGRAFSLGRGVGLQRRQRGVGPAHAPLVLHIAYQVGHGARGGGTGQQRQEGRQCAKLRELVHFVFL